MSTCTSALPAPKPEIRKPEHKLANAADFRNDVRQEDCYESPREISLPKSQKWVLLRKPKPLAYTLLGAPLPGIPIDGAETPSKLPEEQLLEVASWLARLWGNVFVHPKLSLKPEVDEIHPDWVPEEDQQFIWRWIRGEVTDSGESLSTFPRSV
jgi:hypothetical protein